MKIYNTLTRQKEEFKPINKGKAGIYVCGPTVYNYIHIGNARPICVFDVLRRFLKYIGYEVKFVQNFTDVDDKIIKRANEEGVEASEISEKYIKEYLTDLRGLNALEADISPKVTESMDIIIDLIKILVDKGYAYQAEGDVYFRTRKFKGYGKLINQSIDDLMSGARIDVNDIKEDPLDFALWKAAKEGEPFWESPWGRGRPGWHIECSAMSKYYIGDTIDIHGGGVDLIFPHHENEIAQSEAATGEPLAHYWMHNGHINIDNKKMSKSAGNFFTTRDVAEKYGYEAIRYLMIQAHYRSPINYSIELLDACKASLERLYNCRSSIDRAFESAPDGDLSGDVKAFLDNRKTQFIDALSDDLNTADALSAIFELVREINTLVSGGNAVKGELKACAEVFDELTGVLGICYNRDKKDTIPEEIKKLAEERQEARKAKDFVKADALRDKISELGYIIEETRQGTTIKKK